MTWTQRTSVQSKKNLSKYMMQMKNLDNYLVVQLHYLSFLLRTNTKSLSPTRREAVFKVLLKRVVQRVVRVPKRTQSLFTMARNLRECRLRARTKST